jgi:hypothetical protein
LGFGTSGYCDSGENVYNVLNKNSYVFEYTAANSEKSAVNNFFIKEIAKYNLSSLYNTKFTYHYSISKKIKKISTYTYEVEIQLEGEKCTGNTFYKGFDIADILMPELAELIVIVKENGNYIQSHELFELEQDNHIFKTTFEFDTQDEKKDFDLVITDIGFYSEDSDKNLFYERINQIDNYYAGIAAIENSLQRFEEVNFSPSMMSKSYFILQEFKRVFELIENSPFINKLGIDANRQPDFFVKIAEFDNKLKQYSFQYNSRLNELDYLFLSDDLTGLAEVYVNEINYFCLLSDETTHAQQTYFYNLGMVSYSDQDVMDFAFGFNNILGRTNHKNDAETFIPLFYQEVLAVYLQKSDELIENEEYNLARGLLLNAQRFTLAFFDKEPPLKLNILLSRANYGIYNSYLHLIDRAIEIGNYELADNYIEKAKIFQQQNSASIISTQSIRNVSVELVKLYLNKGFKQMKNEDFVEANYCFEQAQDKCREIEIYYHDYVIKHGLLESRNGLYHQYVFQAQTALLNNDYEMAKKYLEKAQDLVKSYPAQIVELKEFYEVKSKLMQQTYNTHITDGENYLAGGNFTQSYFEFLSAVHLHNNPDIITNDSVMGLFRKVAVKYLQYQCQLGAVKVKKKELDEAKVIYNNCLAIQNEYGLCSEQDLIAGLALLNNDIINEQCNSIKEEYDLLLVQIQNLVKQGKHEQAQYLLTLTTELSQSNYSCGINQADLSEYREFVPYAAEYQQLAIKAQNALENNDNSRLLQVFKKMELLSSEHEYIRIWIEPKPLFYLFSIKRNLAFLETSIDSYNSEEEMEIALRMMNVLESGAATGRESKLIQEQLAEKFATSDRNVTPASDPSLNVEKYTQGKSYYKYFKKAYVHSWNAQ